MPVTVHIGGDYYTISEDAEYYIIHLDEYHGGTYNFTFYKFLVKDNAPQGPHLSIAERLKGDPPPMEVEAQCDLWNAIALYERKKNKMSFSADELKTLKDTLKSALNLINNRY